MEDFEVVVVPRTNFWETVEVTVAVVVVRPVTPPQLRGVLLDGLWELDECLLFLEDEEGDEATRTDMSRTSSTRLRATVSVTVVTWVETFEAFAAVAFFEV